MRQHGAIARRVLVRLLGFKQWERAEAFTMLLVT